MQEKGKRLPKKLRKQIPKVLGGRIGFGVINFSKSEKRKFAIDMRKQRNKSAELQRKETESVKRLRELKNRREK